RQWILAGLGVVGVVFIVFPLVLLGGLRVVSGDDGADGSLQAAALMRAGLTALQLEITTPPTDDGSGAVSPDGRQIAFVAIRDHVPVLWVRPLDAGESQPLRGTDGASFPFWSPDGKSLGFFADNKLKRIDVAGGSPIVITDAPTARGGAWGPDGTILF